jgi:hypothetical protein
VLYNGTGRWTAARHIAELIVPLPNALARYRPQHRYHLIDEGRIGEETLGQATSVAAELVRLETLAVEGPEALRPILRRLGTRLQGPRYASLRRALTVWFARVLLRRLLPGENLPQLHDLGEVETMLSEHVDEWTRAGRAMLKPDGVCPINRGGTGHSPRPERLIRRRPLIETGRFGENVSDGANAPSGHCRWPFP